MTETVGTKFCKGCATRLPATDDVFSRYPSGGFRVKCRQCRAREERRRVGRDPQKRTASTKAWRRANPERLAAMQKKAKLKARHGITQQEYELIYLDQGGVCAICASSDGGGAWGVLVVDHCHRSGHVRSLLCHNCNTALGLMGDDAKRLRAAADYLDKNNGEESSGDGSNAVVKLASVKQELRQGIIVHA